MSLNSKKMPGHIAIVMDGNGRWANIRGLPRLAGHNAGMMALKEIVKTASGLNIKHLTVYAFSTENWKRPENEIGGIFRLLVNYVDRELSSLHENHVRVSVLGNYEMLPSGAVEKLEEALEKTKNNTGLGFHIALNYGSRDEILRAFTSLSASVQKENLLKITEEMFERYLDTSGIPDPDLVIRTGGERRLSNFLLWQSAYSEFIFTDVYWPDFTEDHFMAAITEYQGRVRRFGGIK